MSAEQWHKLHGTYQAMGDPYHDVLPKPKHLPESRFGPDGKCLSCGNTADVCAASECGSRNALGNARDD